MKTHAGKLQDLQTSTFPTEKVREKVLALNQEGPFDKIQMTGYLGQCYANATLKPVRNEVWLRLQLRVDARQFVETKNHM